MDGFSAPPPEVSSMCKFPLLLLAPTLALALARVPVPGPVDSHGDKIPYGASEVIEDGTLVVTDTARRYWWSRDQGAHWDTIPVFDTLEGTEFYGQVVTGDRSLRKIWRWATGWTDVSMPSVCRETNYQSTMSSVGWMGTTSDNNPGKITYCRSTDGLLTWKPWFTMDTASAWGNGWERFGVFAKGMVWYNVADSSYLRGTSDGIHWVRIAIPSDWTNFLLDPFMAGLSLLRPVDDSDVELATTIDSGRTWNIRSPIHPGDWILPAADHLYWSVTIDPSDKSRKLWVASSEIGPWELVTSRVQMFQFSGQASRGIWMWVLNDGNTPYLVDSTGLNRLVLGTTSTTPGSTHLRASMVSMSKFVQIDLPDMIVGTAWTQVGLDGRIVASGVLARPGLELALHPGPTLLRIGATTWKLPPL
jgi:hypothetical protein